MKLIKDNKGIFILVAICAIIHGVFLFLNLQAKSKGAKTVSEIKTTKSQIIALKSREVGPSKANVDKAVANTAVLKDHFEQKLRALRAKKPVKPNDSDTRLPTSIKGQINKYRKICNTKDPITDKVKIIIDEDEAFGFARYARKFVITERLKPFIAPIDKQRIILDYLTEELIDSEPTEIISIKREFIEDKNRGKKETARGRNRNKNKEDESAVASDDFEIDPLLSAKEEAAIDTLAFEMKFVGNTNSLRKLMNSLISREKMPIVIRNIDIKPEKLEAESEKKKNKPKQENALSALFGGGYDDEKEKESEEAKKTREASEAEKKPVITKTLSVFTLTVEYIDIVIDVEKKKDQKG